MSFTRIPHRATHLVLPFPPQINILDDEIRGMVIKYEVLYVKVEKRVVAET